MRGALLAVLLALPAGAAEIDYPTWTKIMLKVRDHGEYKQPERLVPPYFTLARFKGDRAKDHQADYVSVMGLLDQDGRFHPTEVRFVSETWSAMPDGQGRKLRQWLIGGDLFGRMTDYNHNERLPGKPASDFPLTKEQAFAKFAELSKRWAEEPVP